MRDIDESQYRSDFWVELGPIRLSWHGLMYVLVFLSYLLVRITKEEGIWHFKTGCGGLYFYLIIGLMVGPGQYVLFYDLKMYSPIL
jgi:prolipoprotein diacylglyceryltransferase